MRWHIANWIGLALALGALALGLGSAIVIAREPHMALQQVGRELGLSASDARDYQRVLAAAQTKSTTPAPSPSAPAPTAAPPPSQDLQPALEAARTAAKAAAAREAEAKARIALLEQEINRLQVALSESPEQPVAQLALPAGARPCEASATPFRCVLRFEPGSAGLDTVDRTRLARLVESLRGMKLGAATIEITGMADRQTLDQAILQDLDCSQSDTNRDSRLACERAASVLEALRTALAGQAGITFAPVKAQLAITPRASPSYRRTEILVRAS